MDELERKYEEFREMIRDCGSLAVAFSGGVDSTFLLKVAKDVLGDRAAAVTAESASFPKREQEEAAAFCREQGIARYAVVTDEMQLEGFRENPVNRCYICKKAIFTALWETAKQHGLEHLAEGTNTDDLNDYRPGMIAIRELGVMSPLRQVGLSKQEIRILSRRLGLPTWSKPSYACLASRFVYGETITPEKLIMVDRAEQLLSEMGFVQNRVRIHGTMARIELLPEDIEKLFQSGEYRHVAEELKNYGFSYVTLDLQGYRTGSMNEVIDTGLK